jgi:hypothetical protein
MEIFCPSFSREIGFLFHIGFQYLGLPTAHYSSFPSLFEIILRNNQTLRFVK